MFNRAVLRFYAQQYLQYKCGSNVFLKPTKTVSDLWFLVLWCPRGIMFCLRCHFFCRKGVHRSFEWQYNDWATFREIRLPREATPARNKCMHFLSCKKNLGTVLADSNIIFVFFFAMPFKMESLLFWGTFLLWFWCRFRERWAAEAAIRVDRQILPLSLQSHHALGSASNYRRHFCHRHVFQMFND